ncbi:MAG: TasA family protein [Acidimicrobiia bacterium]|nr:TasA family protein [Acidimicrobiia bacterium]
MQRTHHGRLWLHALAGTLALAIVGFMVIRASTAAFFDTTVNTGNGFAAGTVTLTDDDTTTALFDLANLAPGDGATSCIAVTYSGSLDATVKLYAAVTGGTGLDSYLDVTVERGSGGSFADCGAFTVDEVVYSGTLSGLAATAQDFGSGLGAWAAIGGAPDDVVTYRVAVTLQDDDAAQGLDASASFTWEAQNS